MSTPSNMLTSAANPSVTSMSDNQTVKHDHPSRAQSPYQSPTNSSSDDNLDHPSYTSFGAAHVIDLSPMDPLLRLQTLNITAQDQATTSTHSTTPISPCSAGNILQCNDVDSVTLHEIAKSLVSTIRKREVLHQSIVTALKNRIKGLEERVGHYTDMFDRCLEGYEENYHYPGLTVPTSQGLSREVKWIKQVDPQTVFCYTAEDSPSSTPHILKVYAQPIITTNPVEPLPAWFRHTITGPSMAFHTLREAAHKLDDWGVEADLDRYCTLEDALCQSLAEAKKHQADTDRYRIAKGLCEARLEAAHAASSLMHMEGLAPTLTCHAHGGRGEQVARRGRWKRTWYHRDMVE